MALTAKQQAGWMFTAGNIVFAVASSGATYLAIEPKAGALVAIIGAGFVLMVSGAGRAAGAFLAENQWIIGSLFFILLAGVSFVDYMTNDMGLKEVAQGAEDKRLTGNNDIEAARVALEEYILRKNELETFKSNAQSSEPSVVKAVQMELRDLGFYKGPIDGSRDGGTNAAMEMWSETNDIANELVRLNKKIEEKREIAAGKIDNEASFLTLEMAGLLAYVISGGSLACSFLGGFLCSGHEKENEQLALERMRDEAKAERDALEREKVEKAERDASEAAQAEQLAKAMNDRMNDMRERIAGMVS